MLKNASLELEEVVTLTVMAVIGKAHMQQVCQTFIEIDHRHSFKGKWFQL